MNKKNLFKLVLDIGMVIVLALMYNKTAISMSFHEIGGLALLGIFLIHILINWKWVVTITKKLFNKSIKTKIRIGYFLNVLLLITFALIGISGIFISKVVFHISSNGGLSWKTIHYTASAIALILIGIHIGLHHQFIGSMLKKIIPVPQKVRMVLGALFTVIIVTYGCYSVVTSSFTTWLFMPFTMQQMSEDFAKGERPQRSETVEEFSQEERPLMEDSEASESIDRDNDKREIPEGASPEDGGTPREGQKGFPEGGEGRPAGGENFPVGGKEAMGQTSGISNVLTILARYFSIMFVFAAITTLVSKLFIVGKRKKVVENKMVEPV